MVVPGRTVTLSVDSMYPSCHPLADLFFHLIDFAEGDKKSLFQRAKGEEKEHGQQAPFPAKLMLIQILIYPVLQENNFKKGKQNE